MKVVGFVLVLLTIGVGVAFYMARPVEAPARIVPEAEQESGFVGQAVCATCHQEETEQWTLSGHSKHAKPRATPTKPADLSIGSNWMQAYMSEDAEGHYRIHPLCFNLRTGHWESVSTILDAIRGDAGVGIELPEIKFAHRTFEGDCAGCHASGATVRLDPATRHMEARWRDIAIDCEACHGPGRAHAEAWQALDDSVPMVKLGTLSPRERIAVCARCHGGPPAASDYGPSDVPDYVTAVHPLPGKFSSGASAGQSYQAESFMRSPCHTEAGFACADCHDAHGPGFRTPGDKMCTSCHEAESGPEHTHHDPAGEGARCVNCHMPRLLDGVLQDQRDHRIGIPRPYAHAPDACTSCHDDKDKAWTATWIETWWGPPDPEVMAAVEAIYMARTSDPEDVREGLERALELPDPFFRRVAMQLLKRPEAVIDDPVAEVRSAAVRLAIGMKDTEPVLRAALRDEKAQIRAIAWIELLLRGEDVGRPNVSDLRVAVRHSRESPGGHLMLALADLRGGRTKQAVRWLEEALALEPKFDIAWLALMVAYDADGRTADADAIVSWWARKRRPPSYLEQMFGLWQRAGFGRSAERALELIRIKGSEETGP